jgi:hypothetical protein
MVAEQKGQIPEALRLEQDFLAKKGQELSQREQDEVRGRIVRLRELQQKAPSAVVPAVAAAAPSSAPRRDVLVPPGAIGLVAGGGALLVLGIACGAAALADRGRLYGGVFPEEVDPLQSRNAALNGAAIGLDLAGGVALAAGATWAIVHRFRHKAKSVAAFRPSVAALPPSVAALW